MPAAIMSPCLLSNYILLAEVGAFLCFEKTLTHAHFDTFSNAAGHYTTADYMKLDTLM
jgi:hypothetical protein